ncbi:hypothetical protein F5X99DRAFT_409705 [Biscogniauxia marginata]|nr:hypothetical protein F5X99DRAFT_409705 [Biscogniauxia marginata]
MYARLHTDHLPTPLPLPNQPAHKVTTLRDRLIDGSESTARPQLDKPRAHYSIASLFNRYRKPSVNEDDSSIERLRTHRYPRSPSPEPEPPIIAELTSRYAELRTTLHSGIVTRLEEAQEELTNQAVDSIKAKQIELAQLEARSNQLYAPLRSAKVDYEAVGEDNQKRQTTEEAQAEIEELGKEALLAASSSSSNDGISKHLRGALPKLTSGMSPSHIDAVVEFASDLDKESKEVVEEMMEYEKEFLQKIENEASSIVQSFLSN